MKIVVMSLVLNAGRLKQVSLAAMFVVLAYSIVSFTLTKDALKASAWNGGDPPYSNEGGICPTLLACFVAHLQQGAYQMPLSVLEKAPQLPESFSDYISLLTIGWQIGFFLVVTVVFVSVVSGSVTDTFGQLRQVADLAEQQLKTRCWLCGIGLAPKFPRQNLGGRIVFQLISSLL